MLLLSGTADLASKGFYEDLSKAMGGRWAVGGRAVATAAEVGWRWETTFSREGPRLPFGDSVEKQEVKKNNPLHWLPVNKGD